jgi:DeoR family fructose operon transcriptional repressor
MGNVTETGTDKGKLFAEERKARIVDYVNQHKKATVQELCRRFSVSSATIRNDLRELEQNNYLIRTHGGALIKTQTGYEATIEQRHVERSEEKRRIAAEAIKLVRNGDSIVLDTGTTTYELARLLGQRSGITVVTNDLDIALLLEQFDSVQVLLMGGLLRRRFHCTVGEAGGRMLSSLRVDKAFMGADSISTTDGASTPDIHTAETKRSMISIAAHVTLLCDSDKLNRRSFAKFADVSQIDTLVTNRISDEDFARFEQNDIEVIMAG